MPSHWATVCLGGILALYSLGTENPRLHISKDATYVCLWWHRFDNCRLATAYINNDRVGCRSGAFFPIFLWFMHCTAALYLCSPTQTCSGNIPHEKISVTWLGFRILLHQVWMLIKSRLYSCGHFWWCLWSFFVTFYVVNVTECKILLMSMSHIMHFDPANIHHDGNIERFALENKCSFSVPLHFACAIDVEIILLDWKTEFYVHLCELMCNP